MPIIPLNRTEVFIGRAKELRRIREGLNDPGFVIVTGRMGSGKTAIFRKLHEENPSRTTLIDMRCTDIREAHEGIPDFRRIMVMARTVDWNILIDSMPQEVSAFREAFKMNHMYDMRCAVSMRYSRRFLQELEEEIPGVAVISIPPFTERETEDYIQRKAPTFRATAAGMKYIHGLTEGLPLFIDSFLNVLSDGIIYGPLLLEENFRAKFQQIAFPWMAELSQLSKGEKRILEDLTDAPIPQRDVEAEELEKLELRGLVELSGGEWSLTSELLRRVLTELRKQFGCI